MVSREQQIGLDLLTVEQESNQQRYNELEGLMEGRLWVEIETETHQITIKPEEECEMRGGCLEIEIKRLDKYKLTFEYHLNRFNGIVDFDVNGEINAEEYGIPGGGTVEVFEQINLVYNGVVRDFGQNFGKLSAFILDQVAVGHKTLPETEQSEV